jgi:hypothetical protein
MTDKDVKFYLALKKNINFTPASILILIIMFLLNGYFDLVNFTSAGLSYVISILLVMNLLQAIFRDTTESKSHALIEKLINSNPELLNKVTTYNMHNK